MISVFVRLLKDNNIDFYNFVHHLKFKLTVEHNIYKKNNTIFNFSIFVSVWTTSVPFVLVTNKLAYLKKGLL